MALFKKKSVVNEEPVLPELPETEDLTLPSDIKEPDLPELPEITTEAQDIKSEISPLSKNLEKSGFVPSQETETGISKVSKLSKEPLPTVSEAMPMPEPEPVPVVMPKPVHHAVPKPTHVPPTPVGIPIPVKKSRSEKPVYVRLDKFELTNQIFDEIKDKVKEIERLLSKIKEVKVQEEKELSEWESDIDSIKARIDSIDKNIFNKLE